MLKNEFIKGATEKAVAPFYCGSNQKIMGKAKPLYDLIDNDADAKSDGEKILWLLKNKSAEVKESELFGQIGCFLPLILEARNQDPVMIGIDKAFRALGGAYSFK